MSQWPATKARGVLAALLRIGWTIKRHSGGSHRVMARPDWPDVVFAFHDDEEIGPKDAGANREADGTSTRRPGVLRAAGQMEAAVCRLYLSTIVRRWHSTDSASRSTL